MDIVSIIPLELCTCQDIIYSLIPRPCPGNETKYMYDFAQYKKKKVIGNIFFLAQNVSRNSNNNI